MLKLSNIRLSSKPKEENIRHTAASILQIPEFLVKNAELLKLSIDARRKPDVRFVCTLCVTAEDEKTILGKGIAGVSPYTPPEKYVFPYSGLVSGETPVIVGMGPAGLFAALCLAEAGIKCIILERGKPVDDRVSDVTRFWREGTLNPSSNVQFGEGGAGTFSDGKLTTGINDRRVRFVLETLAASGAPKDILYLANPHIGTDMLRAVIKTIRERLLLLGCDIRFGHRLCDLEISHGVLQNAIVEDNETRYAVPAKKLILAPGNSARDTFAMLYKRGARLSAKNFSVGVRIEHLQRDIDMAQYGRNSLWHDTDIARHDQKSLRHDLPAAGYKLAAHLKEGRSVYSFCVCPGGTVIASSSEPGGVVTNGMSEYLRRGENCNGALLVTVTPDDFGREPLAGVRFQRMLERAAFNAGGGGYFAPTQYAGDFLAKRNPRVKCGVIPSYRPGVKYINLWDALPGLICEPLRAALFEFERRVSGFSSGVLTAVETRSSSPVRIERENYEASGIHGLFPCGEGAGWAGGIMSAAVDGIRCAEALSTSLL